MPMLLRRAVFSPKGPPPYSPQCRKSAGRIWGCNILFRLTRRYPLLAANGRLGAACGATAAAVFYEVVEIFAAIVVGYFLPKIDTAQRDKHDSPLAQHRLGIRPAGMIDITRHIPSWGTVHNPSAVEFEHIFRTPSFASIRFLGGNAPATVGRDIGGPLDRLGCEQTEPRN